MILKTRVVAESRYKGTSKFPFWRQINIGDEIEITFDVRSYLIGTAKVDLHNLTNNTKIRESAPTVHTYLNKIDHRVIS